MNLAEAFTKPKHSNVFNVARFLSSHGLAQTVIWKDEDESIPPVESMHCQPETISHPPQLLGAGLESKPFSPDWRGFIHECGTLCQDQALVAKRLMKPLAKQLTERFSREFFCMYLATSRIINRHFNKSIGCVKGL